MSLGIQWDGDGRATVTVEASSGSGTLVDLTPRVVMQLAVLLARSGASRGAAWPAPVWDDATVTKLRAIVDPTVLPVEVQTHLKDLERRILAVRDQLDAANAKLQAICDELPEPV